VLVESTGWRERANNWTARGSSRRSSGHGRHFDGGGSVLRGCSKER
jgi:hypothetical protein